MANGHWQENPIDSRVQHGWLEGGKRLHLQHGPIDLIIEASGEALQIAMAYQQAYDSFQTVLTDLMSEIDYLRQPVAADSRVFTGQVAGRMAAATGHFGGLPCIMTPMIAVAGSVADHILQSMLAGTKLTRAYVNNGGDIALWLASDQTFTIGICDNTQTGNISSNITLQACHGIGGIATSGWRGRSYSLGIADAVTVLASCAADADAAATLIANSVDVPGAANIHRTPARELSPDSDLGTIPVTVGVDQLDSLQIRTALDNGKLRAEQLLATGHIEAVYLSVEKQTIVCDALQQTQLAGAVHA